MSDNFKQFVHYFKDAWETETLQDKSEIRKHRFTYELSINQSCIYVYLWNHKCVAARLEPERCWIDDRNLFRILKDLLPEYLPYLQNQKNLTQTGMSIEPSSV